MNPPVVSAMTAGVLLMLQLILMLTVGAYRARRKIYIGVGEDAELERLIRRHGNLSENAALFVIALALLEMTGAAANWIALLAGVFVAARVSHALGFSSLSGSHGTPVRPFFAGTRILGALGTALSGLALGALLLFSSPAYAGETNRNVDACRAALIAEARENAADRTIKLDRISGSVKQRLRFLVRDGTQRRSVVCRVSRGKVRALEWKAPHGTRRQD